MSWTDDRVALLKKLWGEGKTAAEIAKELGGVTRNAVIGKAHRLKLSNRVSPIQQNKKPAPVAKTPTAANTPGKETKKQKPAKIAAVHEDMSKARYTLLELKGSMCRWPIGDPQTEEFGFCGDSCVPGLPYCAEHGKVAYQAATRNRILKAEDFEEKPKRNEEAEQDEALAVKSAAS